MTRSLLLTVTVLALVVPAHAQSRGAGGQAAVTGTVRDAAGLPVAGAFVRVGDDGGPTAITDIDGAFAIAGAPVGATTVTVVADLYEPRAYEVVVEPGGLSLEVELEASAPAAGETIVLTAEAPALAEPPTYEIDAEEIRTLPGSGNDTLKSLQSLPGVARVPFGLGGLILRGSSPRDSNVYLDGVEVPVLYHFGGLASFYPSSMLDSLELIPGAFGVEYGRAQGGIVTMRSRPGRGDRWRVASEVSLIDASVRAEGPAPLGGAWTIGLRRSYIDAVLGLAIPEDSELSLTLAPRYYDGQLRYDLELAPGERITASLFGSDDRLRFAVSDAMEEDAFDYQSSFVRAALAYRKRYESVELALTPWIGVDATTLTVGEQGSSADSVPMGARASLTRTFGAGYVAGGLDVQGGRFAVTTNNQPPPMPGLDRDEIVRSERADWLADVAFWTEGLYNIEGGRLGIKPGVRVERYDISSEWVVDPRLVVSHALPWGVTLRESLGLYHQPPLWADVDPMFGNPDLRASRSVQATVGADLELPGDVEASVTGFYDRLYDQPVDVVTSATAAAEGRDQGGAVSASVELSREQFGSYAYQENVGAGRNWGAELLVKRMTGRFAGWLAYTYSRAMRRDDPTRYFDYRPYALDQPHVVTALGSVAVTRDWRLGARVRFASGNPITPVAGTYFDADAQRVRPIDGAILSERLPAFFQLDLRADRSWRRPWGTLKLFVDIQNATNRANAEGVSYNFDYSDRSYTRGLPIFPSIGLEYTP